jgi:hypothetical protein
MLGFVSVQLSIIDVRLHMVSLYRRYNLQVQELTWSVRCLEEKIEYLDLVTDEYKMIKVFGIVMGQMCTIVIRDIFLILFMSAAMFLMRLGGNCMISLYVLSQSVNDWGIAWTNVLNLYVLTVTNETMTWSNVINTH